VDRCDAAGQGEGGEEGVAGGEVRGVGSGAVLEEETLLLRAQAAPRRHVAALRGVGAGGGGWLEYVPTPVEFEKSLRNKVLIQVTGEGAR